MLQSTILQIGDAVVSLGRGARRGSGLVIGEDRVLTLRHPLRADRVQISVGARAAHEGRLIGVDEGAGVAVFDVPTGDATPARWATAMPAIGSAVYALGNPGSGLRITEGRVSAEAVSIRSRQGRRLEMIEHTAPLPRGTGGGPLLDEDGAVLGVNALRVETGFLLALPAATLRDAIDAVLAGRRPARLGVALASPAAGRRMRRAVGLPERDGLLVRGVEDGSAADAAGVLEGDLLVALAGIDLHGVDDLHQALDRAQDGDPVELRVLRATEERALAVDLAGARG